MKYLILPALLLISMNAMASGIHMVQICSPLVTDEGMPRIDFHTETTGAPGDPSSTERYAEISGYGRLNRIKDNQYEKDVTITLEILKTPSGVGTKYFWLNLESGTTGLKAIGNELFRCKLK